MYIRATNKLKEYKHGWVKRNYTFTITGQQFLDFMAGDHMEVPDLEAQNLITNGMAQKVWKPTN